MRRSRSQPHPLNHGLATGEYAPFRTPPRRASSRRTGRGPSRYKNPAILTRPPTRHQTPPPKQPHAQSSSQAANTCSAWPRSSFRSRLVGSHHRRTRTEPHRVSGRSDRGRTADHADERHIPRCVGDRLRGPDPSITLPREGSPRARGSVAVMRRRSGHVQPARLPRQEHRARTGSTWLILTTSSSTCSILVRDVCARTVRQFAPRL